MTEKKPTLEYGKQNLPRAPFWALLVMGLLSGIVGSVTVGAGFALFHHDTFEDALILAGLGVCGVVVTVLGLGLTWGRRYR